MDAPRKTNLWGDNYGNSQVNQPYTENSLPAPSLENLNPLLPSYLNYTAPQSNKMGLALMITMLSTAFLSVTSAIVSGTLLLGYVTKNEIDSYHVQTASETVGSLIVFINVIIGTIIGVTIIVLSIIAISKNKGRSYAILALIIAIITPIVGFISFGILTA